MTGQGRRIAAPLSLATVTPLTGGEPVSFGPFKPSPDYPIMVRT